jgi:hypothetical protein
MKVYDSYIEYVVLARLDAQVYYVEIDRTHNEDSYPSCTFDYRVRYFTGQLQILNNIDINAKVLELEYYSQIVGYKSQD